jgi:nicotinate-nucleotide adenylyltransferase
MDDQARDSVRRVGVMGGTFDPLHVGHLVIASEALHEFRLDRVTFMPTGHPWQKRSYSDPEDRYLMTVLGTSGNPKFTVSRMELDRTGPTYTADTMRDLKSFHGPQVELFFIVGADAVLKLGTWARIEKLREQASVIAVTRPGFDLSNFKGEGSWPDVRIMSSPPVDISSTQIRTRVREGRPIDYLVPAEVAAYIREQGLYVGGEEIQNAAG